MKTTIKIMSLIVAFMLVLIEAYLITSSIIEKNNEAKAIEFYCQERCDYNPANLLWEFSGESIEKGFTTKDECLNYCSRIKQGFVYTFLKEQGTAAISNILK